MQDANGRPSPFPSDVEDAVETIDAAIFTGDLFVRDAEARKVMLEICERWTHEIKGIAGT